MSYNVYLAEFQQLGPREHHGIFVTSATDENQSVGTLYHVTGNPGLGMKHEVLRNYNLGKSKKLLRKTKIATLSNSKLQEFDSLAPTIPAPYDPNSIFNAPAAEDCQNWAGKFITAAVDGGIVEKTE
jgi:hypothetical protein